MPERTENGASSSSPPSFPASGRDRDGGGGPVVGRSGRSGALSAGRAAMAILLLLLTGLILLAVRLSLAPVSLDVVREHVLGRFNAGGSGWRATSGPVRVRLRPGAGTVVLSGEDLELTRRDGRARLAFPRVEATVSFWPLLVGRVELRALAIPDAEVEWVWSAAALAESLRLAITRASSGASAAVSARAGTKRSTEAALPGAVMTNAGRGRLAELAALLERLGTFSAEGEKAAARLSRLETLEIGHARVLLVERGSGARWTLPDARLVFAADRGGRSLGLAGEVFGRRGRLGELALDVVLEEGARRRRVALRVRHLGIADLVEAIPDLSPLAGIAMPLDLTIHARSAGRRLLEHAALRLEAGPGTLALPPFYRRPRAFSHLSVALSLDVPGARLLLDRFVATFGKARVEVSGESRLSGDGAPPELSYEGRFDGLDIAGLVDYWPDGPAAPARRWIAEHIDAGRLGEGRLRVRLDRAAFEGARLPADAVMLDFAFSGLKVRYLPPMPPLEEARGRGRLDLSALDLTLAGGRVGRVDARGTRVRLTRLDRPRPQKAHIELALAGPIDSLLATLDSPPLGFPGRFGLDPASVEGAARASARLDFPLIRELTLDGVRFAVEGEVKNFRYHGFEAQGESLLRSPRLSVRVAEDGMDVQGRVEMGGLTARMSWREEFATAADAPSSRFHLKGETDLARMPFFGAVLAAHAAGRAGFEVDLTGHGFDIVGARVEADLGTARLAIAPFAWEKPAGRPARLAFRVARVGAAGDGETGGSKEGGARKVARWRFGDLSFEAGEDRVAGEGEFLLVPQAGTSAETSSRTAGRDEAVAPTSALVLRGLRLDPLRLGLTDAAISAETRFDDEAGEEVLVAKVRARSIDARGVLGDLELGRFSEGPRATGLALDLMADSVVGLNGVNFTAVEMTARRDRRSWHAARLRAADDHGAPISLDLAFAEDCGCRRLTLAAEDAGRTALGLGLFENAREGRLSLEAEMAPAGQARLTMKGLARVENVTLVRRATLVKVLEKGRESGLDAYIGEHGLAFREIRLPFRVDGPLVDLNDGRARGAQLGLTVEGQVDRATGEVSLNGLIVPAYALNALLGRIPILGSIFTGGKGGGLFALSYRVRGRIDAPEISVNPLTMLTPGILRKPFEGGKGRVSPQEPVDLPSSPSSGTGRGSDDGMRKAGAGRNDASGTGKGGAEESPVPHGTDPQNGAGRDGTERGDVDPRDDG